VILFELTGSERDPIYQQLEVSNGNRQYDFLRSVVLASVAARKPFLSQQIIKALNFQAITCLHICAGDYRPCDVTAGQHVPPSHYRVPALMDDFVNDVNRHWEQTDAILLATFALWRLNNIHPFINGNGRTARAVCYFILCLRSGGWLRGSTILPELIRQNHQEYVDALQKAHNSAVAGSEPDLADLHALITRLLDEQFQTAGISTETPEAGPTN
jgi:fido (protein-threonine AMPylation protein)